jgi:tetratricopeptide (TPR) repeat protein
VNVKDCAPFASLHRPDLSGSPAEAWQGLFAAGIKAQESGDFQQAVADYDHAEQIDGSFAEVHFRRGQCALALKDNAAAQKEFTAALDLDALRFRCDSRLNDIIRRHATGGVVLADGERALAEAEPDGLPGAEFFYEHVHLTFPGNYVLARAIAAQVENALQLPANSPWPDMAACAQRLAQTPRDTQLALSDMLGRLTDVPFTFQANHAEQMNRLSDAARNLPPANSAPALSQAQAAAEAALARWPDDGELWEQLGEIKQAQQDFAGAAAAAKHSLDLIPSSAQGWLLYGTSLAQEEKYEEAIAAFRAVFALDPQAVWARHNLALCLEKLGRRDEAVAEFKHALALKPDYGTALLSLGQLYEEMGRTNSAAQCYAAALTNRVNQADDLAALARFCAKRGWFGLAATNFISAVQLAPSDPSLRMEAGRALAAFGRHDEAARQYEAAVELAPNQFPPHMQLGVELGRLGNAALAEQEFRQALALNPNSIEARADLGVALYRQAKLDEARKEFDDVLQRDPTDATALRFAQQLRSQSPSP